MNESQQQKINLVLKDFRKEIDKLDNEIIKLIGKRFKIIRQVAKIKQKNNIPSFLSDRVLEVRDNAVKLAEKYKVNTKFIYGMYNSMIMHSCLLEDEEISKNNKNKKKK